VFLDISATAVAVFDHVADTLSVQFLSAGTVFSLSSLGCALVVGSAALAWRRLRRGRRLAPRPFLRMLFPRKLFRSSTSAADLLCVLFNMFAIGALVGYVTISANWLTQLEFGALQGVLGPHAPRAAPSFASSALQTLVLFLFFEFGTWLSHYVSHNVPALWEFHKVHHTAESMTPLTVSRFHPVEIAQIANFQVVFLSIATAATMWATGDVPRPFAIGGNNMFYVLSLHAWLHLQHTNIWIPFVGVWGWIFNSPAHHQIHHSKDPEHFNRNLGSTLVVFDALFGTLLVPTREPRKFEYGVAGEDERAHTPSGLYLDPFRRAFAALARGGEPRPELVSERRTA
jgi:sterol desaturase/sphingolipid hydroxylase (fatty acid hydroxylase superfamily)